MGPRKTPIATHANGALITTANPAVAGEVIILFGTGVGNVSNQPAAGATTSLFLTAKTTVSPSITVGGSTAQVQFAGLTSGFVGLAQFNISVAESITGRWQSAAIGQSPAGD